MTKSTTVFGSVEYEDGEWLRYGVWQMMSLLMQGGQDSTARLPTLLDLLETCGEPVPMVKSTANVTSTAETMKDARKAVLVMEDGDLVGIFTPKDMMRRVVARGKAPDFTEVSSEVGSSLQGKEWFARSLTDVRAHHVMCLYGQGVHRDDQGPHDLTPRDHGPGCAKGDAEPGLPPYAHQGRVPDRRSGGRDGAGHIHHG